MRKSPRVTEKDTPLNPDSNSDTGEDTLARSDRGLPPSTPRWVKVFGIIALILVLLFVVLHLTGRGFGGHTSSIKHGEQQP